MPVYTKNCDEKFTDEDLNELGNAFARHYYAADNAPYLEVYENALSKSVSHLYAVPDTWESFEKLMPKISFVEFQSAHQF